MTIKELVEYIDIKGSIIANLLSEHRIDDSTNKKITDLVDPTIGCIINPTFNTNTYQELSLKSKKMINQFFLLTEIYSYKNQKCYGFLTNSVSKIETDIGCNSRINVLRAIRSINIINDRLEDKTVSILDTLNSTLDYENSTDINKNNQILSAIMLITYTAFIEEQARNMDTTITNRVISQFMLHGANYLFVSKNLEKILSKDRIGLIEQLTI